VGRLRVYDSNVSEGVAQSAGLIGRMLDEYALLDSDRGNDRSRAGANDEKASHDHYRKQESQPPPIPVCTGHHVRYAHIGSCDSVVPTNQAVLCRF
jgi:hypothetical protein